MYPCQICGRECVSVRAYCIHQTCHRNVPNVQFLCPFQDCRKSLISNASFQTHISKQHKHRRQSHDNLHNNRPSSIEHRKGIYFKCNVQDCFLQFLDFELLISHLKIHISNGQEITCPYTGCINKFKVKSSFSSHVSRKHFKVEKETLSVYSEDSSTTEYNDIDEHIDRPNQGQNEKLTDDIDMKDIEESQCEDNDLENDFLTSAALFLLKLQSKQLIPQSTIQFIVSEIGSLYSSGWLYLKSKLQHILMSNGLSEAAVLTLISELEKEDIFSNISAEKGPFSSHFKRANFYKSSFHFVAPVKFEVGRNESGSRYAYYIPLEDTISFLFMDESVRRQYHNPLICKDNLIQDFKDGSHFRMRPFFQDTSNISIILYQDAFEIVNPIGAAKTKHKMVGVYFTLGNFYPWNRSKIDTIQLCMLVYEKDLNEFGVSNTFKPFLNDIKRFETEGFHNITGLTGPLKGSLLVCLGDNLGSNFMAGLVESFSGEYWCRYCLYAKSDNVNEPKELRTEENYRQALEYLETNPNLSNYKGVKHNSVLNELSHFHASSSFPPCTAHDIFEGVVAYDLQLIVNYFVDKKWFSFDYINSQIKTYHLVLNDVVDRPCPIKPRKSKLSGNAMQIWCLLRVMPFLIEKKIQDIEDKVWKFFVSLKNLVELICAPSYSYGQLSYMKSLIEEYIVSHKKLFPDQTLKPKHHFLTHYPSLTSKFGPLIRAWTMRMESKHSYFKRCVRRFQNFKNIGHTLSEQHQFLQAFYSSGSLFGSEFSFNNSEPLSLNQLDELSQEAVLHSTIDSKECLTCDSVTFRGTKYVRETYLLLLDNSESFQIAKIIHFIVHQNQPFCIVHVNEANLLPSYGVYRVNQITNSYSVYKLTDKLFDYYALPSYDFLGFKCITLKHTIPNKQ